MNTTITPAHQNKPAYIYVRQSTLAQVRHNQESTERQYALQDKALALGWPQRSIRVLDRDLGMSGAQSAGREDFKTLVADVSMGQVGAVFALEVSRLARSNLDWHRLLELCALTHTLVIDADGCYDPADFNDGLLLGLKGTMAQAELHFLRGRLLGGKLNKARKGELRFPLPVGFCYDEQDRIVVDPDDEVRGAVQLVFRLFQETGSAYAVVQRFAQDGLRFPKRAYGGAWAGKLIWGRLSHGRVRTLIKNPSYAGTYVFGRYQYARSITADGEVRKNMRAVPMPDWRVHQIKTDPSSSSDDSRSALDPAERLVCMSVKRTKIIKALPPLTAHSLTASERRVIEDAPNQGSLRVRRLPSSERLRVKHFLNAACLGEQSIGFSSVEPLDTSDLLEGRREHPPDFGAVLAGAYTQPKLMDHGTNLAALPWRDCQVLVDVDSHDRARTTAVEDRVLVTRGLETAGTQHSVDLRDCPSLVLGRQSSWMGYGDVVDEAAVPQAALAQRLNRLRQAAVRRTRSSARLPVALHASGGDLQQPPDQPR